MKTPSSKTMISKLGLLSASAVLALAVFSNTSYALNYDSDLGGNYSETRQALKEQNLKLKAEREAAEKAAAAAAEIAKKECQVEGAKIISEMGAVTGETLTDKGIDCMLNPGTLWAFIHGASDMRAAIDAQHAAQMNQK
jgi:hypothetical protein